MRTPIRAKVLTHSTLDQPARAELKAIPQYSTAQIALIFRQSARERREALVGLCRRLFAGKLAEKRRSGAILRDNNL